MTHRLSSVMIHVMNTFSEILKTLRGDQTQSQIAVKLGIVPSAVANWETGRQKPRRAMLPLLAKVLGCDGEMLEKAVYPEESADPGGPSNA